MLVLSVLQQRLLQTLQPPKLHTAVLFTPAGQLISAATDTSRPKDDIFLIVSTGVEAWQESKDQDHAMIEIEVQNGCLLIDLLYPTIS
jgi:hypothetical protein